jgi:LDH2 family malate/lactate/ureidoglycolate dehydrogenase
MPTIAPERLKEAVIEVLKGVGAAEDEAFLVAESLIRAEMRGTDTHGLPYLTLLVERVEARLVSVPTLVKVLKEDGATALLDGGNGIGQVAGWKAMEMSVRKAREFGIGLTLVRNTNNLGFLAFYTMHAAEQGFVGITMGNANAAISPWGGAEAFFGTNPLSIAVPGSGEPLALDMSSSVVARGKIRKAQRLGEKIPPGWALDESGTPTEDPEAALKGTLLPIGGPKGYGLALMVDVLAGMLSGAAFGRDIKSFHQLMGPTGVGALTLAINVERFMPLGHFRNLMKGYLDSIRGSRKANGTARIYLPGEIESEKEKASRARGIELKAASIDMVNQMLEKLQNPMRL